MKTIILIVIVAIIAFYSLRSVYKMLKGEKSGCGCGCKECGSKNNCHSNK